MGDLGETKTTFETQVPTHGGDTIETDFIEFSDLKEFVKLSMDFTLLLQDTTIRIYERTDGSTYRTIDVGIYPVDYTRTDTAEITDNVTVELDGGGQDMKVTLQSAVAEAGALNIPITIRSTNRE